MNSEKACRVCLSECEELTPLYRNLSGENKTLEEAINFVANINIRLGDELPDKICTICETVLDLADTFKQRCLESESMLGQQAQNHKTLPKCDKSDRESIEINPEDTSCLPSSISQTSLTDVFIEITESPVNIYDFPELKIKMEIDEHHVDTGVTLSEQENLATRAYDIQNEQCILKKEFSSETTKYCDDEDIFLCPHCNLTLKTKISYKVHIFFNHSKFCHRKDAPSLKKPKVEDKHPTTAEVKSATEDPAAADTSTATVIGTEDVFLKAKKTCIIRQKKYVKHSKLRQNRTKKNYRNKMKKESTKDTAAALKLSGTKTDDKITCATEKQSECSNNTVIGTPGDIPICDICGYTTATVKSLNSHLKAHAATKPYSCDSCLYLTTKLSQFNNHVRTHSSDKPYSCNVCDKKFSQRGNLYMHFRIHTGMRPHSCEVCQKQFSLKHHLNEHMRTHTGERPYSCDACGRQFTRKSSLVEHASTHTSYKPYPCDVCKKKFRHRRYLVKHLKSCVILT